MDKIKCIVCGRKITKSGFSNPYRCRDCESDEIGEDLNYSYLDRRIS